MITNKQRAKLPHEVWSLGDEMLGAKNDLMLAMNEVKKSDRPNNDTIILFIESAINQIEVACKVLIKDYKEGL